VIENGLKGVLKGVFFFGFQTERKRTLRSFVCKIISKSRSDMIRGAFDRSMAVLNAQTTLKVITASSSPRGLLKVVGLDDFC